MPRLNIEVHCNVDPASAGISATLIISISSLFARTDAYFGALVDEERDRIPKSFQTP
jgi:hypothetical protein